MRNRKIEPYVFTISFLVWLYFHMNEIYLLDKYVDSLLK